MHFPVKKVVGMSLMALFISACSTDHQYKREVSGNEAYLSSPQLKPLTVPAGLVLPIATGTYQVEQSQTSGAEGKTLDIRPPEQPLALLDASTAKYANGVSSLLIPSHDYKQQMWSQIVTLLQQKNIKLPEKDDSKHQLETDWVIWPRGDEAVAYQGRYLLNFDKKGSQLVLTSKLLELRHQLQVVTDPINIQRYSVSMINMIGGQLANAEHERKEKLIAEQAHAKAIVLQSGNDDTGLPNIIARANYATTWERLPKALENLGMEVKDREQSKGTYTVQYKGLSDQQWAAHGVANPNLKETEYKVQLGDLSNRTSIQFSTSSGEYLKEEQNKQLIPVLEAAFLQ